LHSGISIYHRDPINWVDSINWDDPINWVDPANWVDPYMYEHVRGSPQAAGWPRDRGMTVILQRMGAVLDLRWVGGWGGGYIHTSSGEIWARSGPRVNYDINCDKLRKLR
jgi:hypothetical protein